MNLEQNGINFRPCGDCHACCEGFLNAIAYGNKFGQGKPCKFLCNKQCTIYETRPEVCRKYECAWSQGIIPEWLKPNKVGVLISVETNPDKSQYLRVIEMKPTVDYAVYQTIKEWCQNNNTYYIRVPYYDAIGELNQ